MLPEAVLTVKRNRPLWLISTQHGAVWLSANGEAPIEDSVPSAPTRNAETVPAPAPPWALETNSWLGLVGRNSLPKGPGPWEGKGDPGAAVRRPSDPTVKLSIAESVGVAPTRVPTSCVAVELNSTSPGCALTGSANVEFAIGRRCPPRSSVNPV